MLKKKLLAVALVGACALPGAVFAEEATSPHTLTGNVMLTSGYAFRGISQTDEGAAIQGGFDYAHGPSGLYAGTWASNGSDAANGVADNGDFDYDDYKVSIAKAFAGLTLALAYVGTQDADAFAAFTQASNPDIGDDRVIFSVSKTF